MNNRYIKSILIILAAVALLLFVNFLTGNKLKLFSRAGNATGVLSLPASMSVTTVETFDIPVMVSSPDNSLGGIDVVIAFDRSVMQLTDITPHPENSTLQNFMPQTSGNFDKNQFIQNANNSGQIKFGVFSYDTRFQGDLGPGNPLATLHFRATNPGQTNINYVFTSGATNDSNLVDANAQDTLGSVSNLTLTITGDVARKTGDANGDGDIDAIDLGLVIQSYYGNPPRFPQADLDGDGSVDAIDLNLVIQNYYK